MTDVEGQTGGGPEVELAALRLEVEQARRMLEMKDAFVARELAAAAGQVDSFREDAERYRGLRESLDRHPVIRRIATGLRHLVR